MRKRIGLGAMVAVTALTLAACSSSETPSGPTSSAPEPTTGSGAELVVWVDANRLPAVQAAAAAFEAETGATVTLVEKNFADLRADFIAQVPTGEGPDITVGAHDWLGALVTAGVVAPVDLGSKANEFEQVALDAFSYDGQMYGLPYALEAIALIQNVDMVGTEAPTSWEDMIARAEAAGAEQPFVINTNGATGDGYTMYPFQTSFGAPVFVQDETGSYTSEVGMAGPEGVAFAEWLYANGSAGTGILSTDVDYDINNAIFVEGRAPYTVQGPWVISTYEDAGLNVAVNAVPSAGGQDARPFVGVQGFYVSSQSKNGLLANEFLATYLATEEAQQALYDADPRIPAYKSVAAKVADDPIVGGFIAAASQGVPMPSIPEMGTVWDFWNAAESAVISGAEPVGTWTKMNEDLSAALGG